MGIWDIFIAVVATAMVIYVLIPDGR